MGRSRVQAPTSPLVPRAPVTPQGGGGVVVGRRGGGASAPQVPVLLWSPQGCPHAANTVHAGRWRCTEKPLAAVGAACSVCGGLGASTGVRGWPGVGRFHQAVPPPVWVARGSVIGLFPPRWAKRALVTHLARCSGGTHTGARWSSVAGGLGCHMINRWGAFGRHGIALHGCCCGLSKGGWVGGGGGGALSPRPADNAVAPALCAFGSST